MTPNKSALTAIATRREFMKRAAEFAGALCVPTALTGCSGGSNPTDTPGAASLPMGSSTTALATGSFLPTADSMQAMVQKMVDFGPRLTGSPAHVAYLDYLESELTAIGCQVTRDSFSFTRWNATACSLDLLDASGSATPVTVAGYFPYSGSTPPGGVTGSLVSIDLPAENLPATLTGISDFEAFIQSLASNLVASLQASLLTIPGGVSGSVVLLNAVIPTLTTGIFLPFLTYAKPADLATLPLGEFKRPAFTLISSQLLDALRGAGAVGAIFALDASPANAAGQYVPFSTPLDTLPTLLVDNVVGTALRSSAALRPMVRLTLQADTYPNANTDSLVAILPGASAENMIVNTHTDGQNAFEENGGLACLAIAQHYASIPQPQRPRTLVISLVTGHMVANLPQAQGFVDSHPDLIANATCSITIEHLGATEWVDDAGGYHATGNPEFGAAFHSNTPISTVLQGTYAASAVTAAYLFRPIVDAFFGVGGPLNMAGVPSIGYLTSPNYLVAIADNGHIDKLDPDRMLAETLWFIDTLHQLETMTAQQISGAGNYEGL